MKEELIEKLPTMSNGELVSKLQTFSEYIGIAKFKAEYERLEELCLLDMLCAEEILKRLSINN